MQLLDRRRFFRYEEPAYLELEPSSVTLDADGSTTAVVSVTSNVTWDVIAT
jgi:hypothetical protein